MNTWLLQDISDEESQAFDNLRHWINFYGDSYTVLQNCFWNLTLDLILEKFPPENRIIPFGSRELAKFVHPRFTVWWDWEYNYADLRSLGADFINHDLIIITPADFPQNLPDAKYFIKQNRGFNQYKGEVVSAYSLPDRMAGFVSNEVDETEEFILCPVKPIIDEYRLWAVNGEVVTASRYSKNHILEYENMDNNRELISWLTERLGNIPFKGKTFVVDIYSTPEGYKIGEINCINCSGWYRANMEKIVKSLV